MNDAATLERIRAAGPDIGAVCAFGQLIREPLLSELRLLNVHPSLLPRWRGAAPIERTILSGDTTTGVTILEVSAGLDSGPIALAEEVEVGNRDYGALAEVLAGIAGDLLVRALDLAAAGKLELSEQDDAAATYAEKIDRDERRLDPSRPALELERTVRALTPQVGAHLELESGERLRIWQARVVPGGLEQGEVEEVDGALRLGTGEGTLEITRVQPPGGRPMACADYLRGHDLPRFA